MNEYTFIVTAITVEEYLLADYHFEIEMRDSEGNTVNPVINDDAMAAFEIFTSTVLHPNLRYLVKCS